MNKFIQFELWKNCDVGCTFCFNKFQPNLDTKEKLKSINYVKSILLSDQIEDYSDIGFIGGEFFQGQISDEGVKKGFYELIDLIIKLIKDNKINKFYIATSLIFDMDKEFNQFLQKFVDQKVLKRLEICTSYDIIGRFKTEKQKTLWETNMKKLHNVYPMLSLHTQIIVTQNFIDNVLNNTFDIKEFESTYNTSIDYNVPHAGYDYRDKTEFDRMVPKFLPKRKDFLKFLNKTVLQDKTIDINRLFNCKLKADAIYINYIHTTYKITNKNHKTLLPFGLYEKSGYVDSDVKIWDDVEQFKKEVI